jgi:hypothetical protein
MSTEDALRFADELAAEYHLEQIARLDGIIANAGTKHGQGYLDSITADRDHHVANQPNPSALLSELMDVIRREVRG